MKMDDNEKFETGGRAFKGVDEIINKAGWAAADLFKSFMNDVLIPAIDGRQCRGEHDRKPRPGEIVYFNDYDGAEKSEGYGIYAGSGEVIAIVSETGIIGSIEKISLNVFLSGLKDFFIIDMEEFRDDIEKDQELSQKLSGNGTKLEFTGDENSLSRANSLIGCETSESSAEAMLAMALWCRAGLSERKDAALVKGLLDNYTIRVKNFSKENEDNENNEMNAEPEDECQFKDNDKDKDEVEVENEKERKCTNPSSNETSSND